MNRLSLTDGGIETWLIFDDGFALPHFAAFPLLDNAIGRAALMRYYERYIDVALGAGFGFVLESPTWRANPDWARRLGYSTRALAAANLSAIQLLHGLRKRYQTPAMPTVVSGCIGPRADGYVANHLMRPDDAQAYHAEQVAVFADAGCDRVTAITMTNVPEAIGIARAATARGVSCVVSYTVVTDGRLPTGRTLEDAIVDVDAATDAAPAFYMINCAHPSHFAAALDDGAAWTSRLGGVRANASTKSHAELNDATELDRGDPVALAAAHRALARHVPGLSVFGGCCGTDHRHVAAIADALRTADVS